MAGWLTRRLLGGAATVLVVVVAAFLLFELLPGDPFDFGDDPSLTLADRQHLAAVYGLDRPAAERLASFLGHAAVGDFGVSLRFHRPVREVLAQALGPTLLLAGSALLLAFALGLTLGTRAVLHPRGPSGILVHRLLPVLDALPPFWLGLLGIWVFAWKLGWLPASHMHAATGAAGPADLLYHLLLPCLVLGLPAAAPVARHHAAALGEAWSSRATTSGRALGIGEGRLLARAGRAAIQPALALAGLALPAVVGGAVVVEVVFSWPGLGRIHQEALQARDVPLVLGGLILIATAVVAGGLLTDLAGAWADPRQRRRLGGGR